MPALSTAACQRPAWLSIMLAALAVLATSGGQAQAAPTPAERSVLAPVLTLLDGIRHRDKEMINTVIMPEGGASVVRNGTLIQFKLGNLIDRLPDGSDALEERLDHPLVRIDDNLAVVWSAYGFLINGKMHHCGTDLFNLVRHDGQWLITSIAYNSRTDCHV